MTSSITMEKLTLMMKCLIVIGIITIINFLIPLTFTNNNNYTIVYYMKTMNGNLLTLTMNLFCFLIQILLLLLLLLVIITIILINIQNHQMMMTIIINRSIQLVNQILIMIAVESHLVLDNKFVISSVIIKNKIFSNFFYNFDK